MSLLEISAIAGLIAGLLMVVYWMVAINSKGIYLAIGLILAVTSLITLGYVSEHDVQQMHVQALNDVVNNCVDINLYYTNDLYSDEVNRLVTQNYMNAVAANATVKTFRGD